MGRILVVDDEADFRVSLSDALTLAGHQVVQCASADEAFKLLPSQTFDVVLTDLRMPGAGGIELLQRVGSRLPDAILIVMTAFGSLETAIEALRLGAHDFIIKPLRLESLLRKIDFFLRHQAALAENRFLRTTVERALAPTGIIGEGPSFAEVKRLIMRVAPADSSVLITGETGTGKEVAARAIHRESPRREQPFVAINCGSIPETLLESELFGHVRGAFTGADREKRGLFEVAGAGTIFLDEIGEMPLSLQPKMLRALESREILRVGSTSPIRIQARIIAATHRNLARMIEEGHFRADLYYRLNVVEIRMPALREQSQDIPRIATHLLHHLCARMNRPVPAIEPDALRALEQYTWPGNVRELANVLERALILTDGARVVLTDLPGVVQTDHPAIVDDLRAARLRFERTHVLRVLVKHGQDKERAAKALGIDLSSLYRKLELHPGDNGLEPPRSTSETAS